MLETYRVSPKLCSKSHRNFWDKTPPKLRLNHRRHPGRWKLAGVKFPTPKILTPQSSGGIFEDPKTSQNVLHVGNSALHWRVGSRGFYREGEKHLRKHPWLCGFARFRWCIQFGSNLLEKLELVKDHIDHIPWASQNLYFKRCFYGK